MQTLNNRVKWQVSLSNGETLYEDKGNFVRVAGEKSPWQKLISYMAFKEVYITSLSLYTDDGQRFNLPSAGNNPKFSMFDLIDKPLDYSFCHKLLQDHDVVYEGDKASITGTQIVAEYTVIEAIYKEYRLQVWVSDNDPRISWAVVVPHGIQ